MLPIKRFVALACAMLLAGCVAASPPSLSADEVGALKVVAVEGALAQAASSGWMSVTEDFKKSKGLVTIVKESGERDVAPQIIEPTLPREEFRAYVQREFNTRVQKVFAAPLQSELRGNRPVKVVVRMHNALILAPNQRFGAVLLAGQSGDENTLVASIDVVEAATGKTILSLPPQTITGRGGGSGFNFSGNGPVIEPDPMVRMLVELQQRFERWLLRRSA